MTILEVIAMLSLIIAVLGFGYKIGKDVGKKEHRQPKTDQD